MTQDTAAMDVHLAGDKLGVITVHGDVTAASEDALMDAYTRAAESSSSRSPTAAAAARSPKRRSPTSRRSSKGCRSRAAGASS